jgi:hypothetical protein
MEATVQTEIYFVVQNIMEPKFCIISKNSKMSKYDLNMTLFQNDAEICCETNKTLKYAFIRTIKMI